MHSGKSSCLANSILRWRNLACSEKSYYFFISVLSCLKMLNSRKLHTSKHVSVLRDRWRCCILLRNKFGIETCCYPVKSSLNAIKPKASVSKSQNSPPHVQCCQDSIFTYLTFMLFDRIS